LDPKYPGDSECPSPTPQPRSTHNYSTLRVSGAFPIISRRPSQEFVVVSLTPGLRPRASGRALLLSVVVAACSGDATAPSPPTAIAIFSGANQATDAGTAFAQPLVVLVTDAKNAPVRDVAVTFEVTSGTGSVNPASATTDAQGRATTLVTAGTTAGTLVITARAAGVTPTATASFTIRFNFAAIAGQWDGTTSQGLPVYMRVNSSGRIDTLTVRMSLSLGTSTCTGTVVRSNVLINSDGSFTSSVGLGYSTPFRGQFTSQTQASGTIDAYSGGFALICGSSLFIGTTSVSSRTWQATKR
jgi:hypothetical protein